MTWTCPCGWDPATVWPQFSAEWYSVHREAHLAAFPDLDLDSRRNLAMCVDLATAREAKSSHSSDIAPTPPTTTSSRPPEETVAVLASSVE